MFLRGLLVAASGFLFIFSPGVPIGLLTRRARALNRELLYWGLAVWLVALLPSLFLQSLLRQILRGNLGQPPISGQPENYLFAFLGAFITAFFVQLCMALFLRWKRLDDQAVKPGGLAVGFGVGLIAQVFTGLSLVGAGFRLMYGDTGTATLASLAQIDYLRLALGLLPLVLFRPALLVVSGVQGLMAARARAEGSRYFWAGILVSTIFGWAVVALQLALGSKSPGQVLAGDTDVLVGLATSAYYLLAYWLAFRWLKAGVQSWNA
jgi:hypothetical protein